MPPLDDEIISAFLTPDKVWEVCDKLLHSSDPDARMVGRYINDSLPPNFLEDAGINFPIEIAAAAAPGQSMFSIPPFAMQQKAGKQYQPRHSPITF